MRRLRKHAKSSSAFFAMSNSPIFTLPEVGRSSPPNRCSSVDLPTPDSPVTATISPRATSRLRSRKTTTSSARPEYILVRSTARNKTSPFLRMFSKFILATAGHRDTETQRDKETRGEGDKENLLLFPLSPCLLVSLSPCLHLCASVAKSLFTLGPGFHQAVDQRDEKREVAERRMRFDINSSFIERGRARRQRQPVERGRPRRRPSSPTRDRGEHFAGLFLRRSETSDRRRPPRLVRGGQMRRVVETPPTLTRVDQLRQALARAEREEVSDDDRRPVARVARSENLAPLVLFSQKLRAALREDAFDQRLDESLVALRDQPDAILRFTGHVEIGDLVADRAVGLVVLFYP